MTGRVATARLAVLVVGALACSRADRDPAPASGPAPRAAPAAPSVEIVAPLVALVSADGEVWRTDAAGKRRAAQPGALAPGEWLAAGKGSRALVRLEDGRELQLEPGTRLRLQTVSAGQVELELAEGELRSRGEAPERRDSRVALTVLTPFGITRLPFESSQARIALAPKDLRIDVDLGRVAFLDRAGREVTARAQERIEVSVGGLQLLPARIGPAPPPADVVLPTRRGITIYGDDLKAVTLSWPTDLVDADVQVARDAQFHKLLPVERSSAWQATVLAPARGELHWRVVSGRGPAARRLIGEARFEPDVRRSPLDLRNPHNLVEDTGEVTTVHFQGARPALTFTFRPQPGADRYRLRVYRAGSFDTPLTERELRVTRCSVSADLLPEGDYLWHAQALDGTGRELSGGRLHKLTIVYENALRRLAIASPRPGQRVEGSDVKVTGVAPLGARLFVNGTPVPVDGKGRFETRTPSARSLVFRLVDKNGGESYWVRNLRLRS